MSYFVKARTSFLLPGYLDSLGGYRFSLHQLKDWATRVDPSVNETPDDNELDEGEHYCNDEIDYRATCLLAVEEYCIQKYRRRVTFVADASGSGLAALVVTKQRRPYDGETEKIIKRFVLEGEKDLKVKEALERDEKLDVELITAYVG